MLGVKRASQMIKNLILWDFMSYILWVMLIKENSFCSALLQGIKCGLIVQHPKPKEHPCIISCNRRIQSSVISRKEHGSYVFGPRNCSSHGSPAQWKHKLIVLLWYCWEFTGGVIAEGLNCCTKASWFGMIMSVDILQTGPVTHCGAVAGGLWATLSMDLISLELISLSFDPLKSTWLVSDL